MDFSDWPGASDPQRLDLLRDQLRVRHPGVFSSHPSLASRLDAVLDDAWRAYSSVYGTDAAQARGLLDAIGCVVDAYRDRPDILRRIDAEREANGDWFQDSSTVGMMLYANHFAGTLDGVRERLPYLQDLGVSYLHLMPLLETRNGPDDGGYAVKDYRSVNPSLGTMDDLRRLARTLHERGMSLAVDFVMNHTAREHDWAQRAIAGDPHYRAMYFTFPTREEPDAYEDALPEVFPDFAPGNFTYVPAMDRWVWTTFYDFQWDLNYANPDVFRHVLEEMLFLVNAGVDVLRLDAVPFLWKEKGTNCQNLPQAHRILQAYRALVRAVAPGVLFKAEAIVAPSDVIRYLGAEADQPECDTAYNAALMCHLWHALASENVQLLRTMLDGLPEAPGHTVWLNYVRAHDDVGWGIDDADAAQVGQDGHETRVFCADYYAGRLPGSDAEGYDFQRDARTGEARTSGTTAALVGLQRAMVEGTPEDVDRGVQRLLLLHAVVFAMKGVPQIYGGDEIGQFNDYAYLKNPDRAADNRWLHRPTMDWEKAALRSDPTRVEHAVFTGLKQLADTRKTLGVLHGSVPERVLDLPNDAVFAVERKPQDGTPPLLALANFSGHAQPVRRAELPGHWQSGPLRDVLTGEVHRHASGRLVLPPFGYVWHRLALGASDPEPAPTTIRVDVQTAWGEEVYLVGPGETFGHGDPAHAAGPLSAHDYPTWTWEGSLPEGTWTEVRWVKKQGHTVLDVSDATFAVRGGTPKIFRLEE